MSRSSFLFTSESVSEGHPDKVADRISDTVVDAFLAEDPRRAWPARPWSTTNRIVLAGEVRGRHPGHRRPNRAPGSGRDRGRRPRRGQGHRLRAEGLPLGQGQVRLPPARPVGPHRPGRRRLRQEGRGRRRPGHHVRLRLERDARADAGHPAVLPQHPEAPGRGPPLAASTAPGARRQEPGHPAATRTASRSRHLDRASRPSTRSAGLSPRRASRAIVEALRPRGAARGPDHQEDQVARQPDRQLRDRRARTATPA